MLKLAFIARLPPLLKLWLESLAQLFLQLVLAHGSPADVDVQVHAGRGAQAEALGQLLQVELVDVEDLTLLVRGVGLQEAAVAVLG